MFQRSSTYVMTQSNGVRILLTGLYSENSPPTNVSDRLNASFPNRLMEFLAPRMTLDVAEADKYVLNIPHHSPTSTFMYRELLDGLRKRGFKLDLGYKDAGFMLAVWEKAGGYYIGRRGISSTGKG